MREETEVKERFLSKLERETKRQKLKRAIESKERRAIDDAVIEVKERKRERERERERCKTRIFIT